MWSPGPTWPRPNEGGDVHGLLQDAIFFVDPILIKSKDGSSGSSPICPSHC